MELNIHTHKECKIENMQDTQGSDEQAKSNSKSDEGKLDKDQILALYQQGIGQIGESLNKFIDTYFRHDYKGQWIFITVNVVVFGVILTLALCDKITETTTGTLLGAAIGYSLGKYSEGKGKK